MPQLPAAFLNTRYVRCFMRVAPDSERGVVMRDCPGRRRSSSAWISSVVMAILDGQPSMTQPTDLPCDSPHVVTRNSVPKVLPVARVTCLSFCKQASVLEPLMPDP